MSSDTLSDLLRSVRLTGALFLDMELAAPWSTAQLPGRMIAARVLPGVQHLIAYHVITSGSCWAGVLGEERIQLETGDVILFPHSDAHVLSSTPDIEADPDLDTFLTPALAQLPLTLHARKSHGERTRVVSGFLGCDLRPFNPLIHALPRLLLVRGGSWFGQFGQLALAEAREKRAGGEAVLARLSELLFVEAVRRHQQGLPKKSTGWLAALRDEQVGRTLSFLHAQPDRPWTLAELASEIGISRARLTKRFRRLVGESPMQYLTSWRMQVASGLLARGVTVANAARQVGYRSESAFSRAFRKLVGRTPAVWRTDPRADAPARKKEPQAQQPAQSRAA